MFFNTTHATILIFLGVLLGMPVAQLKIKIRFLRFSENLFKFELKILFFPNKLKFVIDIHGHKKIGRLKIYFHHQNHFNKLANYIKKKNPHPLNIV